MWNNSALPFLSIQEARYPGEHEDDDVTLCEGSSKGGRREASYGHGALENKLQQERTVATGGFRVVFCTIM